MRRSLALFVVAAVGSVAACGGGGPYKGLSKDEFIAFADVVCKKYDDQRTLIAKSLDGIKDQKKVADQIEKKIIPVERAEVHDLRKLKPPNEDRDRINKLWDKVDAGTDDAEKTLKKDPARALSSDYNPYKDADAEARAYGFKTCGKV